MSITNTFAVSKFADLNFTGYIPDGTIVTGPDAIKNVIKMYLMSQKGDYGRDITRGGPLFALLGKQVSDLNQKKIHDTIITAMGVFQNIVVTNLDVVKAPRGWILNLTFTDTNNKFVDTLNLSIAEATTT